MKIIAAGSALVALLVSAAPTPQDKDPRDSGPGTIDVSKYPAQQQKNYDVFAAKCAKCHPLARSVNARFSAADWKRYMKRMIRRPNAGINDDQATLIYEFLKYYSGELGL
jgi:hypothetical protein